MKLQRFTGEDWSALYVDGKLDTVGDSYLIDERISEIAGVEEKISEGFFKGGYDYQHVLETADEVFEHIREQEHDAEVKRAAKIEAQARALEEQAKKLREQ